MHAYAYSRSWANILKKSVCWFFSLCPSRSYEREVRFEIGIEIREWNWKFIFRVLELILIQGFKIRFILKIQKIIIHPKVSQFLNKFLQIITLQYSPNSPQNLRQSSFHSLIVCLHTRRFFMCSSMCAIPATI